MTVSAAVAAAGADALARIASDNLLVVRGKAILDAGAFFMTVTSPGNTAAPMDVAVPVGLITDIRTFLNTVFDARVAANKVYTDAAGITWSTVVVERF
jgi:hypothetical protein